VQVRYPDRITLIRGNHESRQITQVGTAWGQLLRQGQHSHNNSSRAAFKGCSCSLQGWRPQQQQQQSRQQPAAATSGAADPSVP
jgi:hypothetical protein